MPDPNKKISSPTLDACDRNVSCTGEKKSKNPSPRSGGSAENKIKAESKETKEEVKIKLKECVNPCATKAESPKICTDSGKNDGKSSAKPAKKCKSTSAKETKVEKAAEPTKGCKSPVKEIQAVLIKEPCPPSPSCQMARPEPKDAKARVDETKPGCIDYESCEDEKGAKAKKDEEQVSGCVKYEDCKDLANDEKRKLDEYKESLKQDKKEKTPKDKEEKPCPKK